MTTSTRTEAREVRDATIVWATAALGLLVVLGATAALVSAGVTIADVFPASGDVARDTGVFRAITAWAAPLGLLGVALLFATSIPLALAQIRTGIHERRDALTTALPQLLQHH